MCLATGSLQVSSARATVDLEQHQSGRSLHCSGALALCVCVCVEVQRNNQFSVCPGRLCVLHSLLHNLTTLKESRDDQHALMHSYHNNNSSGAASVAASAPRRADALSLSPSRPIKRPGTEPCDERRLPFVGSEII